MRSTLCTILISVLLSGCAVFVERVPSDGIPLVRKSDLAVSLAGSFSTHLGSKHATLNQSDMVGVRRASDCLKHRPGDTRDSYLRSMLCKSFLMVRAINPTSKIVTDEKSYVSLQYDIDEGHSLGMKIWSWSNLLTATVIPYRGKRTFSLVVKQYRNGKLVYTKRHNTSFIEWRSILLLPISPFINGYRISSNMVVRDLVSRAMKDLSTLK